MNKTIIDEIKELGATVTPCTNVVYVTMNKDVTDLLLEKNTHNRSNKKDRSNKQISKLARAMCNGEWDTDASNLLIGYDGTLLDGQHRLLAYKKANYPSNIKFKIAYNVDNNIQPHIDKQLSRSLSDDFEVNNFFPQDERINKTKMGTLIKGLFAVNAEGKLQGSSHRDPTYDEVKEIYKDHPFIADTFNHFKGLTQTFGGVSDNIFSQRTDTLVALCAFYKRFSHIADYKERIIDFYNQVRTNKAFGNYDKDKTRSVIDKFINDYMPACTKVLKKKNQTRDTIVYDATWHLLNAYCTGETNVVSGKKFCEKQLKARANALKKVNV